MLKMKNAIPVLMIAMSTAVFGQQVEDPDAHFKTLSLSWGYHHLSFQDKLLSPLVNVGGSVLTGGLEYRWGTSAREFFVNGAYTGYAIGKDDTYAYLSWPDQETRETAWTTLTKIDLGFGMLWSLNPEQKLGFQFNNQFRLVDYAYGNLTLFTYFFNHTLGPVAAWDFDLGERSGLSVGLTVPVVGWVARSPYSINDDKYIKDNSDHSGIKAFGRYIGGGDVAFIWDFQQIIFNTRYSFELSESWCIGAGYSFEFYHYDEPRSVLSYSNNFDIIATFKF